MLHSPNEAVASEFAAIDLISSSSSTFCTRSSPRNCSTPRPPLAPVALVRLLLLSVMQVDPAPSAPTDAAQQQQPSPEEQALGFFARCVLDLLTMWPAVRLALQQGQGFDDSKQALASQVVDLFYGAATSSSSSATGAPAPEGSTSTHEHGIKLPGVDELEEVLKWSFTDEFDVDLEDGSEVQVSKDLIALWRECLQRVFHGSEEEGAMARKFREGAEKAAGAEQFTVQRGEESSEDEESGSEDGDDDEEMSGEAAPAPAPAPRQREEPVVDEDGFEMVQTKKKGGRR
ncbi:hypothetical protein JCM8097_000968 [Rhodosporidiobolus ruineniae]